MCSERLSARCGLFSICNFQNLVVFHLCTVLSNHSWYSIDSNLLLIMKSEVCKGKLQNIDVTEGPYSHVWKCARVSWNLRMSPACRIWVSLQDLALKERYFWLSRQDSLISEGEWTWTDNRILCKEALIGTLEDIQRNAVYISEQAENFTGNPYNTRVGPTAFALLQHINDTRYFPVKARSRMVYESSFGLLKSSQCRILSLKPPVTWGFEMLFLWKPINQIQLEPLHAYFFYIIKILFYSSRD